MAASRRDSQESYSRYLTDKACGRTAAVRSGDRPNEGERSKPLRHEESIVSNRAMNGRPVRVNEYRKAYGTETTQMQLDVVADRLHRTEPNERHSTEPRVCSERERFL